MTKEQQDLAWRCLPKEVREEMFAYHQTLLKQCKEYKALHFENTGAKIQERIATLEYFFGYRNLTSATEPSELLFVEREKVIGYYKDVQQAIGEENGDTKIEMKGREYAMIYLFGDKCFPDEEPSVQVEPRFKVGDKVRVLENADLVDNRGKIAIIIKQGQCCKGYGWVLDISKSVFLESELEPYTESETKRKETQKNAYEQYQEAMVKESRKCDESELADILYEKDGISLENESKIDEMMEEKELNLVELLKGCYGEEFYSTLDGEVKFIGINSDKTQKPIMCTEAYFCADGKYQDKIGAACCFFPSRALYEKYPLDAYSAWMEWKSERTPKRWRAKQNKEFYYFLDDMLIVNNIVDSYNYFCNYRYNLGNYFRTKEEAQQAVEAVKKCLVKFHEQKQEINHNKD